MRSSLLILAALAASAQTKPGGVEGTVVNALTGAPIARAEVMLVFGDNRYWKASDAEGKFSIANVGPGTYDIRGERPGFLDFADRVEVRPDLTVRQYAIKLTPESTITGRVVDPNGQPVEGASVAARGPRRSFQARTNDRGEFRVGGLLPDSYRLVAKPSRPLLPPEIRTDGTKEVHFEDTWYPGVLREAEAAVVDVGAGAEVAGMEIRLAVTPITRVSGVVTGGSLSPIRVETEGVDDPNSQREGIIEGGKFTIWNLPPGKHRIWSRSGTLSSATVEVEMSGADIEGIELDLMLPFAVTGRVEWDGSPPQDPKLEMTLWPGVIHRRTAGFRVDAGGGFAAPTVEPGRYEVWPGGGVYVKALYVGPNEMRDGLLDVSRGPGGQPVTIRVSTGVATLSGVAREAAGPVPLKLERDGRERRPAYNDSGKDGAYSFTNLAPGTYRLSAPRYATETIELREGERVVRDLKPAR